MGNEALGLKVGKFLCLLSIGKFAKVERGLGRGLGDVGKLEMGDEVQGPG